MKRTTIMLPSFLKNKAMIKAQTMGISLGELIRRSLSKTIEKTTDKYERDSIFADDYVYKGPSPKDGAINHDKYIYGDFD